MRGIVIGGLCVWLAGCFPDPPKRASETSGTETSEVDTSQETATETDASELDETNTPEALEVGVETEVEIAEEVSAEVVETHEATDTAEVEDIDVEVDVTPVCVDADDCEVRVCATARCVVGDCVYDALVCSALDQCHDVGVCSPETGQCTTPSRANGTPCDDGVRCMAADGCASGICKGTRAPNDATRGDFGREVTGSHGVQSAGLAANDSDVYLAVSFPLEPALDGQPTVYFGEDATRTAIVATLPEDATYGIAIARYSNRGLILDASIAATSDHPITNTELTWLSSGSLYVSGQFENDIRLFNNFEQQPTYVTTLTQTMGTFGFDYHKPIPDPIIIEQELPLELPPRIVGHPDNCLLVMNIARDRSALVFDARGEQLDAMTNASSNTTEAWISWMPGCLPLTVDARRIGGMTTDGAYAWFADITDSGRAVIGVAAHEGLLYGDTAVQIFSGFRSVILSVEPDAVVFASRIEDSLTHQQTSLPISYAVATAGEDVLFAQQLVGQAELIAGAQRFPLIDNPASPNQLAQRMALIKLDETGKIVWMHSHPEDKEPVFMHMATGSGDVAVATPWSGDFSLGLEMPAVSNDNLVVSTWDADGVRWATPVLSSLEGEAGAIVYDALACPPLITRVPQTAGLFIAGTLEGRAVLGVAKPINAGVTDQTSVFLLRINSEDGIGCPAP